MFHWFTPAKMNHHRLYFTCASCVAATVVFFFMAGTYPMYYLQSSGDSSAAACVSRPGAGLSSPSALTQWITTKQVLLSRHPIMCCCRVQVSQWYNRSAFARMTLIGSSAGASVVLSGTCMAVRRGLPDPLGSLLWSCHQEPRVQVRDSPVQLD